MSVFELPLWFQIWGLNFLNTFWCQCNINYVCCHISIPGKTYHFTKDQTQSSEWLKSSLRPGFRETCVRPHMCVKESQPDSGEVEVRKGLTKRIFRQAERVSLGFALWLPPCCPPLIHLPHLIWFPLMFQQCFNTGGLSISLCDEREGDTLLNVYLNIHELNLAKMHICVIYSFYPLYVAGYSLDENYFILKWWSVKRALNTCYSSLWSLLVIVVEKMD